MKPLGRDERRRIVPRWRAPEATVAAGEVGSSGAAVLVEPNLRRELVEATEVWDSRPSIGAAAELLASAIMLEPTPAVLEAADYILASPDAAGPLLYRRARAVLGVDTNTRGTPLDPSDGIPQRTGGAPEYGKVQSRITPLKQRVAADPRDALAWLEMGRVHATAGNRERAERAVRIAVGLAAQSRFVLRSASRFFLHSGDKNEAHELLRRSPRTRLDPWLSAAEIATAQVAEVTPRTVKTGRSLVASGHFSPHELSELRAALATEALLDNKRKDVRALVSASLQNPTENTVAQALWLARSAQMAEMTVDAQGLLETPGSYEARSYDAYARADWTRAFEEGLHWIEDEPFSGRAAIHAAVIAGVALDRPVEAVALLQAALRASPESFYIRTNLVYNLAIGGRPQEAADLLKDLRAEPKAGVQQVVLLADHGLVGFRTNQVVAGRLAYAEAIVLADRLALVEFKQLATLYYLAEELRINERTNLPRAIEELAKVTVESAPEVRLIATRLQREATRLLRD